MDLSLAVVKKAVKTLLCLPRHDESELNQSFRKIELQISAKKIPRMNTIWIGKFHLPYSLFNKASNVCLFVKDEGSSHRPSRDYDATKEEYMKILHEAGVHEIKEIVPFERLKREFRTFEAKRRLSNAFDGYLADSRIMKDIRPHLGKHFYSRHRFPASVCLTKNVAKSVRNALRASYTLVNKKGACSMMHIGCVDNNSEEEIAANILSAWEQLDSQFPGGKKNIRSLYIKVTGSMAVPVYCDVKCDPDLPVPDLVAYTEEPEAEEIDTISGAKVKIYPDGRVVLVRKQKKSKTKDKDGSCSEDSSESEDEDDTLTKKLIAQDEFMESAKKHKLENRKHQSSKRPLLAGLKTVDNSQNLNDKSS